WIQATRVTSQAFKPTPKDGNELSVYNGDLISAERAWDHFTGQGMKSVGVIGVSVGEAETCGVCARPDPGPFREHAVIDFTSLGSNQIEKSAKKMRGLAETRGWLFQP
ncbi:MAG: hypothetical protein RJA70_1610, partial [Pseudomonadota bacterium]